MRVVPAVRTIQSYVWKYFRRYKCSVQCLLCNKAFVYTTPVGQRSTMLGIQWVVLWGLFIEYFNIRLFWGIFFLALLKFVIAHQVAFLWCIVKACLVILKDGQHLNLTHSYRSYLQSQWLVYWNTAELQLGRGIFAACTSVISFRVVLQKSHVPRFQAFYALSEAINEFFVITHNYELVRAIMFTK